MCFLFAKVSFYRGAVPESIPEEASRRRKGPDSLWLATLPIKLPVSYSASCRKINPDYLVNLDYQNHCPTVWKKGKPLLFLLRAVCVKEGC